MEKQRPSLLFFGKEHDEHVGRAIEFCRLNFSEAHFHLGRFGRDKLPDDVLWWRGDYLISYLSPWIVPDVLLKSAKVAAINFHPGTPKYPGIGCYNFALYEGAIEFGATCHHMESNVDTGAIIDVKRFPIFATDTVGSLVRRTYDLQLALFYEIMGLILSGEPLPTSEEQWQRKPFTRKALNDLSYVTPDMTKEEVSKRIRATTYNSWRPKVKIQDFVFEFKQDSNGLIETLNLSE